MNRTYRRIYFGVVFTCICSEDTCVVTAFNPYIMKFVPYGTFKNILELRAYVNANQDSLNFKKEG